MSGKKPGGDGRNEFGDPDGTMYAGGTPLFDERTGRSIGRDERPRPLVPVRPPPRANRSIVKSMINHKDDPHVVLSSRVFDAPPTAVFAAFADPARLATWWGPRGFTNAFQEFDFRPGGAWRFVMRGPDGTAHHMDKRFVEIVAPARIVLRHIDPIHGFTMTMTFAEEGATRPVTRLTWHMRFDSQDEAAAVRSFVLVANRTSIAWPPTSPREGALSRRGSLRTALR